MAQNDVVEIQLTMTLSLNPASWYLAYRQTSPTVGSGDDVCSILATEVGARIGGLPASLSNEARFESSLGRLVDGTPSPAGTVVFVDAPGTVNSHSLPPQKACLITHKQQSVGVKSNGKTFLPGIAESSTDGGIITNGAVLANIQTVFDQLIQLSFNPGNGQYDFQQVVLGKRPGPGLPHPTYDVTSSTVSSRLANQTRRVTRLFGTSS